MIELDFEYLSEDQKALELFAKAIASNTPPDANVRCRQWSTRQTIPYLARRVEQLTDGKRTVREAAKYLFSLEAFGGCFYLACCSVDTPEGEVTELADDTVLMMLTGSLTFPVKPASAEIIAQGQRAKIEHDTWHRSRASIAEAAEQLAEEIRHVLCSRIEKQITDQNRWTSGALYGMVNNSLTDLLSVCLRLGINFDELVREALS